MDVTENDNEYVLSESDVNVELDDNVLRISGERKSEHEQRTSTCSSVWGSRCHRGLNRPLIRPAPRKPNRPK
jgi:HSP20 family molecular chaperone IbpA